MRLLWLLLLAELPLIPLLVLLMSLQPWRCWTLRRRILPLPIHVLLLPGLLFLSIRFPIPLPLSPPAISLLSPLCPLAILLLPLPLFMPLPPLYFPCLQFPLLPRLSPPPTLLPPHLSLLVFLSLLSSLFCSFTHHLPRSEEAPGVSERKNKNGLS